MEKLKIISRQLVLLFLLFSMTFLFAPSTLAAAQDDSSRSNHLSLPVILPDFKLPWRPDWNGRVYFVGGPHSYCGGGDLGGTYTYGEGSGIDFSSGEGFLVTAMATGQVIAAEWDPALGCKIAVRHDVGNTVLIYSHLNCLDTEYNDLRRRLLSDEDIVIVNQGDVIGKEGNTGIGARGNIHLHLELRDGVPVSNLPPCDTQAEAFGSPVGWEILSMINGQVDGYWFYGYAQGDYQYGPNATMYNYD